MLCSSNQCFCLNLWYIYFWWSSVTNWIWMEWHRHNNELESFELQVKFTSIYGNELGSCGNFKTTNRDILTARWLKCMMKV